MKRREFTQLVGVGLLASSLPVAIAACQTNTPEPSENPSPRAEASSTEAASTEASNADGFAPIGTVADLDVAGVIVNASFQGQNIAVIRNPEAPETVIAVDARCTHAGCTVDWNRDRSLFICPCHGSQFGVDGRPQAGPASDPLGTYAAKIENDQVLVKV